MADIFTTMYRGDTRTIKFAVTDSNGDAVDITGYKFYCSLKSEETDLDAAAAMSVSTTVGDDARDDAAGGICYLTLSSSDTDDITPGVYYYDIQRATNDTPPKVATLESGRVRVLADITRANT